MKAVLFIFALGLMACSSNNKVESNICEEIVFFSDSNWPVDLKSLVHVDDFIMAQRKLSSEGLSPIKPYIRTAQGQRISLRELRPITGRGYFWDCRSHFKIYANEDCSCTSSWVTGESCGDNAKIEIQKSFLSLDSLKQEILLFYSMNSLLTLRHQPDQSDLEIWIVPNDDKLTNCQAVIEHAALAFQEFQKSSDNQEVPFSVVISPKQDKDRLQRIKQRESL